MSASSGHPGSTTVLHDVVMQGEWSLARPRSAQGRVTASPAPLAATSHPGVAIPAPGPSPRANPAGQTVGTVSMAQSATRELDEARRQSYDEGFAKGASEARAQSAEVAKQLAAQTAQRNTRELQERAERMALELTEKSNAEVRAQRETLDALLRTVPAQVEARLDAAQDDMLSLCFEVVCRVLGEAAVHPDAVRAHLRHATQGLRGHRLVAVHLHPDDLPAVRDSAHGSDAEHQAAEEIQWVADATIAAGGCILQSPQGGLDARFDTQLRALRDLLLQSRATVRPQA